MRRCLILFLGLVGSACAQSAPSFEVASVKLAAPCCATGLDRVDYPVPKAGEDRIDFRYVTLRYCIAFAFRVEDYRISGPSWLAGAHFDIEAKGPEGTRHAQLPDMLQTLLAARFGLRLHKEVKEVSALALLTTTGGPKLLESVTDDATAPTVSATMSYNGVGKITVRRASMAEFAEYLSATLHHPVVDLTNLEGRYDLDPAFSNEDTRGTAIIILDNPPQASESATSIYTSIKEFGLKLQPRRLPLEGIVVDRIERTPTGN